MSNLGIVGVFYSHRCVFSRFRLTSTLVWGLRPRTSSRYSTVLARTLRRKRWKQFRKCCFTIISISHLYETAQSHPDLWKLNLFLMGFFPVEAVDLCWCWCISLGFIQHQRRVLAKESFVIVCVWIFINYTKALHHPLSLRDWSYQSRLPCTFHITNLAGCCLSLFELKCGQMLQILFCLLQSTSLVFSGIKRKFQ